KFFLGEAHVNFYFKYVYILNKIMENTQFKDDLLRELNYKLVAEVDKLRKENAEISELKQKYVEIEFKNIEFKAENMKVKVDHAKLKQL
ncbi:10004_t:CDS:1, partial [Cetraspora pellucida]